MIRQEQKQQIVMAIKEQSHMYPSDSKHATVLGINAAILSRLKKKDAVLDNLLSPSKWVLLARKLNVNLTDRKDWNVARTSVYSYITAQLEKCQDDGLSAMLCDASDIGKTFTAKHYASTHKNVAYVDCSQVKNKIQLIRAIAKEFGVNHNGKFLEVYNDMVFCINNAIEKPLIILDEAGDLSAAAFLEIKAIWNAVEGSCAWYMMGADGLETLHRRSVTNKKVGAAEIFSRFGKRYLKALPAGDEGKAKLRRTATDIITANAPKGTDINAILVKTMGEDNVPSLRRIYTELSKIEG